MAYKFPFDPYDRIPPAQGGSPEAGFSVSGDDPLASGTSSFEGEPTKDAWLTSNLRSSNFVRTSRGFGGDGKTGQFSANDFYSGTLRSKAGKGLWIGADRPEEAPFLVGPDGTGRSSMGGGFLAEAGVGMAIGTVVFMDDSGVVWPSGADFSALTSRTVGVTASAVARGNSVFVQNTGVLDGFTAPATGQLYLQNAERRTQAVIGSQWACYGNRYIGQATSWPTGSVGHSWTRLEFTVQRTGSPAGNFNAYLTTGFDPSPVYRAINTVSASSIPTSPTTYALEFYGAPAWTEAGQIPAIAFSVPNGDSLNYIGIHGTIAGTIDGEVLQSLAPFSMWATAPPPPYTNDLSFDAYGNRGRMGATPGTVNFPVGTGLPDGRFLVNI